MIYVFDLDGTLIKTEGMDYMGAKPIRKRIDKLHELANEGHIIIIQTARNKTHEAITVAQLETFNIPYHGLSIGEKVPGDVYIDDKGINDKDFFK